MLAISLFMKSEEKIVYDSSYFSSSIRLNYRIILYIRHSLQCIFTGDALPAFPDCAIKIDCGTLELNTMYYLYHLALVLNSDVDVC